MPPTSPVRAWWWTAGRAPSERAVAGAVPGVRASTGTAPAGSLRQRAELLAGVDRLAEQLPPRVLEPHQLHRLEREGVAVSRGHGDTGQQQAHLDVLQVAHRVPQPLPGGAL